jgi:hypothetical protein
MLMYSFIFKSRPITMVAGPEILEKYIGSSERNLRQIFDHPPRVYDAIQTSQSFYSQALEDTALHVIGMLG